MKRFFRLIAYVFSTVFFVVAALLLLVAASVLSIFDEEGK